MNDLKVHTFEIGDNEINLFSNDSFTSRNLSLRLLIAFLKSTTQREMAGLTLKHIKSIPTTDH